MNTLLQILNQYWGHTKFRPLQEDIIQSVLDGHDTLALMPTGGGKSICFQVPALAKEGICIVISPLIALMKDQVEQLKAKNIRAASIVSGMTKKEVDITLDNCIYGNYKFLYVSPERLESELFLARFKKMPVNLLAVDEAHCISQWGYDFRPPYQRIAAIRELIPNIPILALTATATKEVKKDICNKLEFKNEKIFVKSFTRKNLSYVVMNEEDKLTPMLRILRNVQGSSVVYVRSRRKTQEISDWLNKQNIHAGFYHAGLPNKTRSEKQDLWKKGVVRVIVATNAFGMGIDKADVRSVIHLDLPDNLESYYQEAGRCGRDEKLAYAILICNPHDVIELNHRKEEQFPKIEEIKSVYQALCNYLQIAINAGEGMSYEFDIVAFAAQYKLHPLKVVKRLKILELEDYISLSESIYLPSRIRMLLHDLQLYKFQVEQTVYDHLIKTLLRNYGGIFDDYVAIHEQDIATKSGIDKADAIKLLHQLNNLDVLSYIPQTDKPRITFNRSRADANELIISAEHLELRKKRFVQKADALIHYATDSYHCRSMMLLEYFGEHADQRCGTCDYCRQRNKLEINDLEFEQLTIKIKTSLNNKPIGLNELMETLPISNDEKALKVVQWLLDNDHLIYTDDEKLRVAVK